MKLVFMPHYLLNYIQDDSVKLYNLNSLYEAGVRLHLTPPFEICEYILEDQVQFDIGYANYIFNNEEPFINFIGMVLDIYAGNNVYILSDHINEIDGIILESIVKLLSERYGIISNTINDTIDMTTLVDTSFSINGLYNIDNDKMRYMDILISKNGVDTYGYE